MKVLLGAIAALNIGWAVWGLNSIGNRYSATSPQEWLMLASWVGTGLIVGFVAWRGVGHSTGRIARLIGLWFDAKENDLKKKVGSEAPTEG